jgi:DNA-binding transcriptional LysR family regulator
MSAPREFAMLEWDDLRMLLAVARQGSITAAARSLGVTQPTMSRRMESLEARWGVPLLERGTAGVTLTTLGTSLLECAERMEDAALAAQRRIAARGDGLDGVVRVTTIEYIGHSLLAPSLARFAARHPGLTIDLAIADHLLSLARHEVDIAVRTARFDQDGLVQRRIGTIARGLYASRAYLEARGTPDFAAGCEGHDMVTLPDLPATLPYVQWMTVETAPRARVALRSNSMDVHLAAAVAGIGLALLPRLMGDAAPGLVLLSPPEPPPSRELWLGYHEDLRHTPRVRALAAHLAADIRP